MAQWITRLTTDQKIPGSNPGELVHVTFFVIIYTANLTTNTAASAYTLFRCGKVVQKVSTTLPLQKSKPIP